MKKEPEYISKIKMMMKRYKFNQGDLARVMGRPQQAISEILNLKKDITPETAIQISAALDIGACYLVTEQAKYKLGQARVDWLPIRQASIDLMIVKTSESRS